MWPVHVTCAVCLHVACSCDVCGVFACSMYV